MQAADRSRSPHGHAAYGGGPGAVPGFGPFGGPAARPPHPGGALGAAAAPGELQPLAQQVSAQQLLRGGIQPARLNFQVQQPPAAPVAAGAFYSLPVFSEPVETPEQAEARQHREKVEATERLRQSVERGEGYLQAVMGTVLMNGQSRYTVIAKAPLGVGVFSAVWPCANPDNKLVALKVIRSQDHFRSYAEQEVALLRLVAERSALDKEGSAQVACMLDSFVHTSNAGFQHLCMAFEKLESNLREAGKQPLGKVLAYSKQILVALRYLHDQVGIVHCDVKPDNLLLRWDERSVKLCDFGTARTVDMLQSVDELQPLFYRAPEVYMGNARGRKIDVWSAACTIYELIVGRILFKTCLTHREVVQSIQKLRGPIPKEMLQQGRLANLYFSQKGFHPEVGEPVDPEKTFKKVPMHTEIAPFVDLDMGKQGKSASDAAKAQLSKLIGRTCVVAAATKKSSAQSETDKKVKLLGALLDRLMEVNPASRFSAAEAVSHELLQAVELPPAVDLQDAPPLPEEAPPPLPPEAPPPQA